MKCPKCYVPLDETYDAYTGKNAMYECSCCEYTEPIINIEFYEMTDFIKWLFEKNNMDNTMRYVYMSSGDYFLDENSLIYTWKDLYDIYQEGEE